MSRPLAARKGRKWLLCPSCRTECAVKGGRVAALPIVYLALQGAEQDGGSCLDSRGVALTRRLATAEGRVSVSPQRSRQGSDQPWGAR